MPSFIRDYLKSRFKRGVSVAAVLVLVFLAGWFIRGSRGEPHAAEGDNKMSRMLSGQNVIQGETNLEESSASNAVLEEDEFVVSRVIDGDTVVLSNGERVRYIGIDAPETSDNRVEVRCFAKAAAAKNAELVLGKAVQLVKDVNDTDRYGRLVRYVYQGDIFVNLELVRTGFASAYRYPPDVAHAEEFVAAEREAREAKRGLWSGVCTESAVPSAQGDGCNIKGNISSGGKIYHLPGCGSYEKTVIDESAGERWFCSEADAEAAGWRKAKNC
ncbi:MAG: thermonuclease family protein [Patescibacteria group bacterium]